MRVSHKTDRESLARAEYPPIQEQLEAVWEVVRKLRIPLPPAATEILSRIETANHKYKVEKRD